MKSPRFLCLFAVCALVWLRPSALRAFDVPTFDFGNNISMPAAVVQLFTDLNGISPGTVATDAQHQALVADLDALAVGIFTPDPADVDQLATDLGTAATDGLFSDDVLQDLADDFIDDSGDPADYPDGWMDDLQDDVANLLAPPATVGDPTDPGVGVTYEPGVTAVSPAGEFSSRMSMPLDAQGIPPGLLENYSGRMQLNTHTVAKGATVDTLRLQTFGLPPSNPYTVSITRLSDGTSVTVGKLHVRNGFDDRLAAVPASSVVVPQAEFLTSGGAAFGGKNAKKPLPAGFDAADVATVTVTDSQGVVRLTGSLASGTSAIQLQALHLHLSGASVGSTSVPYGTITARHKVTASGLGVHFHLSAHHLPASAPVTLLADGVSVGQFATTSKGRLIVHALPNDEDLSGAKSFTLIDAQGAVLLSGSLD